MEKIGQCVFPEFRLSAEIASLTPPRQGWYSLSRFLRQSFPCGAVAVSCRTFRPLAIVVSNPFFEASTFDKKSLRTMSRWTKGLSAGDRRRLLFFTLHCPHVALQLGLLCLSPPTLAAVESFRFPSVQRLTPSFPAYVTVPTLQQFSRKSSLVSRHTVSARHTARSDPFANAGSPSCFRYTL